MAAARSIISSLPKSAQNRNVMVYSLDNMPPGRGPHVMAPNVKEIDARRFWTRHLDLPALFKAEVMQKEFSSSHRDFAKHHFGRASAPDASSDAELRAIVGSTFACTVRAPPPNRAESLADSTLQTFVDKSGGHTFFSTWFNSGKTTVAELNAMLE